ncbi:MAG TPA: coproporphyrinogen dehydrogenase HemZ [Peptococcaceae bacterium]|nr:coproporphyrinogen dehydrogenase HemZ [Peptococcaceae bacterium]
MLNEVIKLVSSTIEPKLLHSCITVIAAFFPGKKIEINPDNSHLNEPISEVNADEVLSASGQLVTYKEVVLKINTVTFDSFKVSWTENNKVIHQKIITSNLTLKEIEDESTLPGKEPLFQILVKRALFIFLKEFIKIDNPWGILTGIRPGKLLLKMEERGLPVENQTKVLTNIYMVSEEKARILQSIVEVQKPYIKRYQTRPDLISIYLSIPFCPSRCFYCSFPSEQLSVSKKSLLSQYLHALVEEIRMTGQVMRDYGLKADNIYIGGGTPTILEVSDLEMLLRVIRDNINTEKDLEFTVEAGRPDTIDLDKLELLKKYGVNRLSINPQSMQEETLKKIGRNHLVSDILDSYSLARELADWVINMDLILGLPGESLAEVSDSLEKVLELKPDNITVHALALKRGSKAWEKNYEHNSRENWVGIENYLSKKIRAAGYRPYYLYRQKNIVGNLENIGYAFPGQECRYNVAIIEEQQNILGLGAGGSSKILQGNNGHVNIYNPIGLNHYLKGFREVHIKRREALLNASQ